MRQLFWVVGCFFALLMLAGDVFGADLTLEQARVALRGSATFFRSLSTSGGYAGIYSRDGRERYGEGFYEPIGSTEIWIQPPGTPSVGECFLRAYLITGESIYLEGAREAGRVLAWGQRKAGGWDHTADISHMRMDTTTLERKGGACTFDDNITQGALSFLMKLDEVIEEEWLSEAIRIGLEHMLCSQFENGAWPQWNPSKWWHPLIERYHSYYTFNDGAINDCIRVMLQAHRAYKREEYLCSALLGGDFIISSQLGALQAGWAQQYSHDMKPAWARKFEPPGVSSAATARNIRTLVDLYLHTNDTKYLGPIPSAIEWLRHSMIGDATWSRLYELDSNRPIYGDRDGRIHYDYEEVSEERKRGYGWRGEFGVTSAINYYQEVKVLGPAGYLAERLKPVTPAQRAEKAVRLTQEAEKVIASLDEGGCWVESDMIYCGTFVRNFNLICGYLESQ